MRIPAFTRVRVIALATIVVAFPAAVGQDDAVSAFLDRARSALEQGNEAALATLVASQRLTAYEAVDALLNDSSPTDWPLAEAVATAHAREFRDERLRRRVQTFRGWTEEQRSRRAEALEFKQRGIRAANSGQLDDAAKRFELALGLFRAVGDLREEARCLMNLGAVDGAFGRTEDALRRLEEARTAADRAGDRDLLASIEANRAYVLSDLGDLAGARGALETALPISRESGDRRAEATILAQLGGITFNTGDNDAALEFYQESGRIGRAIGDLQIESIAWANVALVHRRRGDLTSAGEVLRKSVRAAGEAGLHGLEADVALDLAGIERIKGNHDEALAWFERAREVAARVDSPLLKSSIAGFEALRRADDGDSGAALAALDEAEEHLAGLDAPGPRGQIHLLRAVLWFYRGDYDGAEEEARKAVAAAAASSRPDAEAKCRETLGFFLTVLGDTAEGLRQLEAAVRLLASVGASHRRAGALNAIGVLRHRAGDRAGARRALEEALLLLAASEAPADRAEVLLDLAEIEFESGPTRAGEALTRIREAGGVYRKLGDPLGTTHAALLEARVMLAGGDAAAVRAALEEVRSLGPGQRTAQYEWQYHYLRGRLAEAEGEVSTAISAYTSAVSEVERLRAGARQVPWQAALLEDRIAPYRALVRLHADRQEAEAAYRVARMAKARTFVEQLKLPRYDEALPRPPDVSRHLLPPAIAPVERLRSVLGPREILIDFFLDGDRIVVFVVREDRLTVRSLDPEPRVLHGLLEAVRHPGRPVDEDAAVTGVWRRAASKLGGVLLGPLSEELAPTDHLFLVPGGDLHAVPFAALEYRGRALVESRSLSILPAAEVLLSRQGTAQREAGRTLVLGDPETESGLPPLPGAADEARSIAAIVGDEVHLATGPEASESLFRQLAPAAARVHLAAHGRPDRLVPARSHVALAPGDGQDGRLRVSEIASMRLAASMVVLSGCTTARESGIARSASPGDEREGLVRAFLKAGANNVIATLWEQDDANSRLIFPGLYDGDSVACPAVSLARLQRRLIRGKVNGAGGRSLAHPFFWAGLVAYGAGSSGCP